MSSLVKVSSSPFRIAARMSLASRWSTQAARWSSDSSHKVLPNVVGVYEAPKETDDRSPCPGLNALANHGYLCVKHLFNNLFNASDTFRPVHAMAATSQLGTSSSLLQKSTASRNPSRLSSRTGPFSSSKNHYSKKSPSKT